MPDAQKNLGGIILPDVNIYINVYHTGHLKKGTGTYTFVLEYITKKEIPITRESVKRLNETTLNRTALSSCIEALKHLIKNCNVNIYINSNYIVRAVNENTYLNWLETGLNAKGKPASNLDLWQQLCEQIINHDVIFTYEESNPYSSYMQMIANKLTPNQKEDMGNVTKH